MELKLHHDDVRARRRIMHFITRQLSKGDPNRKAAFDAQYKDLVHEAVTVVLYTERMALTALADELARLADDGGPSD